MIVRMIRNATLYITYAGKDFLVDPMLGAKGSQPPFGKSPRQDCRNPLQELPCPVEELLHPDYVIVTHLHRDHFDKVAGEILEKDQPMFVQNEADAEKLAKDFAFTALTPIDEAGTVTIPTEDGREIRLYRVPAQHSDGEGAKLSGLACGVVFTCPGEKTMYLTGDTIWYPPVQEALQKFQPEVVCVNCGENLIYGFSPLTLGQEGVGLIAEEVPHAAIVGIHLESLNHYVQTKADLRAYAEEKGFSSRLLIPEDGERIPF